MSGFLGLIGIVLYSCNFVKSHFPNTGQFIYVIGFRMRAVSLAKSTIPYCEDFLCLGEQSSPYFNATDKSHHEQ